MSLPDQPLLTTKRSLPPETFAATLQATGPLFWWERGGFWIVTDYKLGEEVLKNPAFSCDRSSFFISRMPNLDLRMIGDFFGVITKMMVMSDAPKHNQRRRMAGVAITDEIADRFQPAVDEAVDDLMQAILTRESFDFVKDVAEVLPSRVLAEFFAIPEAMRPAFYRWSYNMTQFFGGASEYRNEDGIEVNHSAVQIRDFFAELIAARKESPQQDFLSTMIRHQQVMGLEDSEMIAQAVMMIVAGQVTTTDQIANNLFSLINRPEIETTLHQHSEQVAMALEEFNRLDPAVTFLFRVVKEPVMLGGRAFQSGDVIFISCHAVNRDPTIFPEPNACRLDRGRNPHFAYGHGPHFCLGAKLARQMMATLFGRLVGAKRRLEFAPGVTPVRKHESLAFSGFESQSVVWSDRLTAGEFPRAAKNPGEADSHHHRYTRQH